MIKFTLLTALIAVLVVPAYAATRHEHKFSLSFSATAASSKSGVKFFTDRFDYKAPPQGELADRVATVTFVMAMNEAKWKQISPADQAAPASGFVSGSTPVAAPADVRPPPVSARRDRRSLIAGAAILAAVVVSGLVWASRARSTRPPTGAVTAPAPHPEARDAGRRT